MHQRQQFVSAQVRIGQLILIQPQLIENRNVDVAEVIGIGDGAEADCFGARNGAAFGLERRPGEQEKLPVRILGAVASIVLIVLVLADGFESILQPRRVTRLYRYARLYYVGTWAIWRAVACRMGAGRRQ